VLSPQEVLQELLGDMYIDQSRLTMGEPHRQRDTGSPSLWAIANIRHTATHLHRDAYQPYGST
jgi:hypothetical protein